MFRKAHISLQYYAKDIRSVCTSVCIVLSISSVLTEASHGFLQSPTNSAVVLNADEGLQNR